MTCPARFPDRIGGLPSVAPGTGSWDEIIVSVSSSSLANDFPATSCVSGKWAASCCLGEGRRYSDMFPVVELIRSEQLKSMGIGGEFWR
jgi:hypothetical protein